LTFEIPAGLLFWPLIPEFPCVRHAMFRNRSFLQKGGNWVLDRAKVFRMSMEIGGTQG
jgi:hypothetical protein